MFKCENDEEIGCIKIVLIQNEHVVHIRGKP